MKRLLSLLRKLIPSVLQVTVVAAIMLTAVVAYNLGARSSGVASPAQATASASRPAPAHPIDEDGDGTIFTCSMHPEIKQDEPGNCPICGMELVPVAVAQSVAEEAVDHSGHGAAAKAEVLGYACAMNCVPPLEEPGNCPICGMEMQPVVADKAAGPTDGDPTRRLTMSREAQALASIETSPVVSRVPRRTIRLVGELAIGEDTVAHISADVGGRIDGLAAEYAGDVVEQGEELVLLYSPELLAVQQEFLQARAALERLPEGALASVRQAGEAAVTAARERLRLAGLSPAQVEAITASGSAREQVTLQAPISGTVVERHAQEGQYVRKGERILTLANLDTLWAEMAAYEGDLAWLQVGQPVTFVSEAFPGRQFAGEVAWIDPVTNMRTRTTRVRLNVLNEDGMLRPGMYLTARVESTLGDGPRLVIPTSAPLITGERAVVYLQLPNAGTPTFQGVEVLLGPRVEDGYVVEQGLEEGQRVVTNGAFQIDSALQIIAKPSMMNPDGGIAMTGHEGHGAAAGTSDAGDATPLHQDGEHPPAPGHQGQESPPTDAMPLDELIGGYLHIQRALAQDDFDHARHAWMELRGRSGQLSELMPGAGSLEGKDALRSAFHALSRHVISRAQAHPGEIHRRLRLVHCPMAFDFSGADWLQAEDEVRNPYFGAEMLTCGTVKQEWSGHD